MPEVDGVDFATGRKKKKKREKKPPKNPRWQRRLGGRMWANRKGGAEMGIDAKVHVSIHAKKVNQKREEGLETASKRTGEEHAPSGRQDEANITTREAWG